MTGFIRCLLVASLILSSLEAREDRGILYWGLASVSLSDTKYIIATNAALASGNCIFIG